MPHSIPPLRGTSARAWKRHAALGTTLLASLISQAYAQDAAQPPAQAASSAQPSQATAKLDTVVVTGYAASLAASAKDKRNATGFIDTVSAEDMGKFPDANIAESLARVPGVQVTRDITGEGVNINVRGLGTSFTKIMLNGSSIAVASASLDAQNTNREVDLDLMPADLFSKLTVYKSPTADLIEGGSSGTVDMRSVRAFDNPGRHLIGSISGTDNTVAGKWGNKGTLIASDTWNNTFGALLGFSFANNQVRTTGFESVGWTNPNLSAAQCSGTCNSTGGGNWTIPSTVPATAGNGLVAGTPINQAFLLANNPGATITQIDNGLVPRLARDMDETGTRDRLSAVLNFEYRPTSNLHFYIDTLAAQKKNNLQRIDMDWALRNGAEIPLNTKYDGTCTSGCVVTQGTYADSSFFLEFRPVIETTRLYNINPGMEWKINDKWKFDAQANASQGSYTRQAPTVLVSTASNLTVNYTNNGGIPTYASSASLDDPTQFGWAGGRVNVQDEMRTTSTRGVHADLTYGDDKFSVKSGFAFDEIDRAIRATDGSAAWQAAVCGNNPSVWLPSPNAQPSCNGASTPGTSAGIYPNLGTGYSTGMTGPVLNQGSLVPSSALSSYLMPGRDGFITVNWNKFASATNYGYYNATALPTSSSASGASVGNIDEQATAIFSELAGTYDLFGHELRYNGGLRFIHTVQTIGGIASTSTDPRNATLGDGALYPSIYNWVYIPSSYDNVLPSGSLAYSLLDNVILRTSLSKTMTRANPNAMLPGVNFSDPSAQNGSIGNTALKPYISKNWDLGLDWYTGRDGYVSLTHFEKRIAGFTETENVTMPFSALAPYGVNYGTLTAQQQQQLNARGGPTAATVIMSEQVNTTGLLNIHGTEFGVQQSFDRWLPIKGFGMTGNVTYVKQDSAVPGAIALGVPKISNNLTLYWERYGYSFRVSENYTQGSQVAGTNQNGISAAALFVDPYKRIDLSARFDLEQILNIDHAPQLSIDVGNLTQAIQRTYFQFENATYSEYKPGRMIAVGLRTQF